MRASLVLSEIGIGLRRNVTLTIAVIVTTAISLSLLGASLIIQHQVDVMHEIYGDSTELRIDLADNITGDQRTQLQQELKADPAVKSVLFRTRADNLRIFREEFGKSQPDLVASATAADLPESFVVKVNHAPQDLDVITSEYQNQPGVKTVMTARESIRKLFALLGGLRNAAFGVAVVQVLAALLLISNTIRVAAFNRRRETGIMRLVGASSFSIQLPFLLEGAAAGLVGGAAACAALAAAKRFLADGVLNSIFASGVIPNVTWGDIFKTMPAILVIGVAISSLASFVTLRRYLRV